MYRLHQDEAQREELLLDLDEIARAGARRMLAEALEAEVHFTSKAPGASATMMVAPWWSATATPESASSSAGVREAAAKPSR
jgi:hypothetical protein